MKTKDILISAICTAITILSASCSSDETINNGDDLPKAAIITASLPQSSVTRATGDSWTPYTTIGVRVNSECRTGCTMASNYNNVEYNVTPSEGDDKNATFAPEGDPIRFIEEGEHSFSAYAPYSSNSSITLNTIDGNKTIAKQKAIDYIYATGAKASPLQPTVSFTGDNQFNHVLSKLNITIKVGEGFNAADINNISSITLKGLKHNGTFDITTGSVTSNATTSDITLNTSDADNIFTRDASSGTLKFSLYLLPQDCSSSPLPLSISYDQATFTNKSSLTPNLTAGKACNYEITMNKSGLVVSNGTLTDWDKADMSSMPGEMEMGSN